MADLILIEICPRANFYLYVSQSETYRAAGISYPRSGYIALAKQAYRAPSADGATPELYSTALFTPMHI
ncbi:MAG: hypothetical protein IIX44_10630 [Clostridia bacterium]|nr:hypothetical protein [Clostridia bacterium]